MLIHFYIKFTSKYGESLQLDLSGNDTKEKKVVPLDYFNAEYWHVSLQQEELPHEHSFAYSCIFKAADNTTREIIHNRKVDIKKIKADVIEIYDDPAHPEYYEKVFQTVPFKMLFKEPKQKEVKKHSDKDPDVIFKVQVPPLGEGKTVCITGSSKRLKEWNEKKALHLNKKDDFWTIKLDLSKETFPIEYKFGIYDLEEKKILEFEAGDNRILTAPEEKDVVSIYHIYPGLSSNKWMGAGINIPVSALKTTQSWGIGDFTSLHLLTDFCRKAGIKLIQLLPVNDTSATLTKKDSYPYAAISIFALHPLYLNVQKLATAFGVELPVETMQQIHELNELPHLEYEAVLRLKMHTIKELYSLEKQSFKDDFAWFEFFDLNRHWLVPYAAFCFLRDKYGTADFKQWKEHKTYDEDVIQELVSPENESYDAIAIHYFIQYHLHLQLKDAAEYAHKNEIIIKGDLPIGVGRCSVDTWMYPHLFHMNMQAGAPPDAFTTKGQNWSFPTYNWEAMAKDNYAWWRQRMEHMGNYFDAVRIDHVLGFYRIWSIPMHAVEGILGKFEPAIALVPDDFNHNGLPFDEDRLCRPYITDGLLETFFPGKAAWVKETFMYGGFLKAEFETQQKIVSWFEKNPLNNDTKQGLLDMAANVILLKDESVAGRYHFRINMYQTASYKDLPYDDQQALDRIYHRYFFEQQNELWEKEGRKKLTALKSCTNMLLCAEDLGMVPDMVEGMLNEMQILSLQVQRMPKTASENFSHPKNAVYLSVVTPSTHDMSTIREWWEDEKEHIQYFYNYLLGFSGEAPFHCEPWIGKEIISQHLQSPAMWSVFLVQDLLSMNGDLRRGNPLEERINNPAFADHTWDYRMHITMEDLLREKLFLSDIKTLVRESGR
jgi:4-alpha-glucanotransferase